MKTFSRMVRRYIGAAFLIVLAVFLVNAALFIGIVLYIGVQAANGSIPAESISLSDIRQLADSFFLDSDGTPVPQPSQPLDTYGFEWSMLLDEEGRVVWHYHLPGSLNHPYTLSQVAGFTRWYLDDYPVFVYINDFGLLVSGMPRGSLSRHNFYIWTDVFNAMLACLGPALVIDLSVLFAACLLLGWRASRSLRGVAQGIDSLARGEAVRVPEHGMAAELAEKLNHTSALLCRQNQIISRRDRARTNWIAGVSHDIRTPLSLIFLHAEELAHDSALTPEQRRKAGSISEQGQKIRSLIEDLNLTSKLQYDAEPLRMASVSLPALLRESVAAFCDSPAGAGCTVELHIAPDTSGAKCTCDKALLRRAIDNLLSNSARHNPQGCRITLCLSLTAQPAFVITLRDDGRGYPPAVLAMLGAPEDASASAAEDFSSPHILGLYLVRRIAMAHGGRAEFLNRSGACCMLTLPVSKA